MKADPDVAEVNGYLETGNPDFVSEDGTTYLAVSLKPTDDKELQDAGSGSTDELEGEPGVSVGGSPSPTSRSTSRSRRTCGPPRCIAFPLLFLLSLLFFRSLVAALLPLMIGALAIVGTFLLLASASELGSISIFALNLTTGLGLGLAIDYSLFVVSRYREEIAKTGPGLQAMRLTMATAGPNGPLLVADGRGGARLADRLPAALPLLDGARRRPGRAARGADRADRAAGGAGAARQPG